MMDMDTPPRARRTDPITSHQAGDAIMEDLTKIQTTVLRFAKTRGADGFHDLELQEALGDHGSTFRTRRRELVDKLMIGNTGKVVRLEGDRRNRIIWAITTKGARV